MKCKGKTKHREGITSSASGAGGYSEKKAISNFCLHRERKEGLGKGGVRGYT